MKKLTKRTVFSAAFSLVGSGALLTWSEPSLASAPFSVDANIGGQAAWNFVAGDTRSPQTQYLTAGVHITFFAKDD